MRLLREIYERLYAHFGPQGWWPAETPFEVAVGAVLTQNTSWANVERAITALKRKGALSARRIHGMPNAELAEIIRPTGYFNVKAVRLKAFVEFLMEGYGGSMARMGMEEMPLVRERLLAVKGIGHETADSIVLYALERPVFVIDAYTKRVLSRHGLVEYREPYEGFQEIFHRGLINPGSVEDIVPFFNEYHALFVAVGKGFCRPKAPLCGECPLEGI